MQNAKLHLSQTVLLFVVTPLLFYGIHSLHFVPQFWHLPFYITIISGIILGVLGILILNKSSQLIDNQSNKYAKRYGVSIITVLVFLWFFLWFIIPFSMHNFIVEKPEKQINIANRTFHLYSFGHKRYSRTIIYEQKNQWLTTRIDDVPYPFEMINAAVKDTNIVFSVHNKPVSIVGLN